MGMVAQAAGVARQTVYASVASKERLIELAFIARLRELRVEVERRPQTAGGVLEDQFVEAFVAMVEVTRGDADFAMYTEALGFAQVIRLLVEDADSHEMVREVLRPHYAQAVADGRLRGGLSLDEATWWVANALTPMVLATTMTSDELRRLARRFILPGLLLDV
jgi:AcrR family transcriptional regulator